MQPQDVHNRTPSITELDVIPTGDNAFYETGLNFSEDIGIVRLKEKPFGSHRRRRSDSVSICGDEYLSVNVQDIRQQSSRLVEAHSQLQKWNRTINWVFAVFSVLNLVIGFILVGLFWEIKVMLMNTIETDYEVRSLAGNITYINEILFDTSLATVYAPEADVDKWQHRYFDSLNLFNDTQERIAEIGPKISESYTQFQHVEQYVHSIQKEAVMQVNKSLIEDVIQTAEGLDLPSIARKFEGDVDDFVAQDVELSDVMLQAGKTLIIVDLGLLVLSILVLAWVIKSRRRQLRLVRKQIQTSHKMLHATLEDPRYSFELTRRDFDLSPDDERKDRKAALITILFSVLVITVSSVLLYADVALDEMNRTQFENCYESSKLHADFLENEEGLRMNSILTVYTGDEYFADRYDYFTEQMATTMELLSLSHPDVDDHALPQTNEFMRLQLDVIGLALSGNLTAAQNVIDSEFRRHQVIAWSNASWVYLIIHEASFTQLETIYFLSMLAIIFVMLWIPFNVFRYYLSRKTQQNIQQGQNFTNTMLEWSLKRLLVNTDTRDMIVDYVEQQMCEELFEFSQALSQWLVKLESGKKTNLEIKLSLAGLKGIYRDFLCHNSPKPVNLNLGICKDIGKRIDDLLCSERVEMSKMEDLRELVLRVQDDVLTLLEANVHVPFLKSQSFQTFLGKRQEAIRSQLSMMNYYERCSTASDSSWPTQRSRSSGMSGSRTPRSTDGLFHF